MVGYVNSHAVWVCVGIGHVCGWVEQVDGVCAISMSKVLLQNLVDSIVVDHVQQIVSVVVAGCTQTHLITGKYMQQLDTVAIV